jgi:hypothetical protein
MRLKPDGERDGQKGCARRKEALLGGMESTQKENDGNGHLGPGK